MRRAVATENDLNGTPDRADADLSPSTGSLPGSTRAPQLRMPESTPTCQRQTMGKANSHMTGTLEVFSQTLLG